MLKRIILGLSLSCLIVVPALAQKPTQKKPMRMTMHSMVETVTGMVKGKVDGKMFNVANKKGAYEVNASKAKVRMNGKFISLSALTGGSSISVKGHVMGMKIAASDITVNHLMKSKVPAPVAVKPKKLKAGGDR